MWTSGFDLKLQATERALQQSLINPLFEARILSFDMCHVDRLFMGSMDFWAKTLSLKISPLVRAPRPHQKRKSKKEKIKVTS